MVGLNHIKAHPSTGNRKPGLLLQIVPYGEFRAPSNSIAFQRSSLITYYLPSLIPDRTSTFFFFHLHQRCSPNVPIFYVSYKQIKIHLFTVYILFKRYFYHPLFDLRSSTPLIELILLPRNMRIINSAIFLSISTKQNNTNGA